MAYDDRGQNRNPGVGLWSRKKDKIMLGAISIVFLCLIGCIYIHLGALTLLRKVPSPFPFLQHFHLVLVVLGAVVAHLFEITLFAVGYAIIDTDQNAVPLTPIESNRGFHPFYHSAVTFTSLGGEVLPTPELRLVTAVEALVGMILIAWTAAFLFLILQQDWSKHGKARGPS
jgi:hypothetical protein